ncbi:MAG: TRAP transporter substrate-binding protein [Bacteroidota bacterium]
MMPASPPLRRSLPALVGLCMLLGACSGTDEVTVLKLGHGLDPSHPVHLGMAFMADHVAEASGGAMRIDLYPSQQLGTERQCLELLQIGSLAMTKVSASVMENFAPNFQVMGLPFLFRDAAHRFAVLEGEIGRELLLQSEAFRLRGLTYYDAGSRSFYTVDRPILHPDDLDGLKIRTQESATAMTMVNTLGGSATPISWGELYTALQQGVVDGAENNPPSFFLSRHYEIAKHYALNEHTGVPDILVISTLIWNELMPQEQQWLQEAADASALHQKQLWAESTAEALAAVEAAGVEIYRPEKGPFMERAAPMLDAYRTSNPALYGLIERIRAVPAEVAPAELTPADTARVTTTSLP